MIDNGGGTLVEAYLERAEPQLLDHLLVRLTKPEFHAVWTVQFLWDAEHYADAFPLERFASPGTPAWTDALGERFLRAVRFLALECGHEFHNLECDRNFSVRGRGKRPQTENRAYLLPVALGARGFDRLAAVRSCIRFAADLRNFPIDAVRTAEAEMVGTLSLRGDPDPRRVEIELRLRHEAEAQLRDLLLRSQGAPN
jgi:hypothetical protein